MATVDLFNLIFTEILKISPTLISRYSTIQDQILYLLLIPSAIILLFVWTFGYWFMGKGHNGLRILISLIAYIYIVWSGWYGTWIIPVILAWFPLILIAFFLFFIISKIFPPLAVGGASNLMKAGFDKIPQKGKEIDKLKKEIDILNKKIIYLKDQKPKVEAQGRHIIDLEVQELEMKVKELKHAIKTLEK